MSQTVSMQLPDELVNRLDRLSRMLGNDTTRSRASMMMVDESLPEHEFSRFEFRNSTVGLQPIVRQTGISVSVLIMVAKGFELNAEHTAEYLHVPVDSVRAALIYYEAYREEIELSLADNNVGEERLKRMFPHMRVTTLSDKVEKS